MAELMGLMPKNEEEPSGLLPKATQPSAELTGLVPKDDPAGLVAKEEPQIATEQETADATGQLPRDRITMPAPVVLTPEEQVKEQRHNQVIADTGKAVGDFDAEFTFMQRQGNRLGVGYTRRQANQMLDTVGGMKTELADIAAGDEAVIERTLVKLSPTGIPPEQGSEEANAMLAEYTTNLRAQLDQTELAYTATQDAVADPQVENRAGDIVSLPTHPVMQALAQAQADGDQDLVNKLMKEFFLDAAAETALPSITQAGPAQVVAPAGAALAARSLVGTKAATTAAFA